MPMTVTTQVVAGSGTLRLLADLLALDMDFTRNADGEQVVSIGAPYHASITIVACKGRRRLIVRAPEATQTERVADV